MERLHRAILGVLYGWSVAIFFFAVRQGYGAEHGLTESLLPLGCAIAAGWSWPDAWQRVGLATAGLCSAHSITVHLAQGGLWAHLLFFAVAGLLSLYGLRVVALFLAVYLVGLHGVLPVMDAHSVYGHGWPWTQRALVIASEAVGVLVALLVSSRVAAREGARGGP